MEEEDIQTLDDFCDKFKNHFWNASVQRGVKRKIEFGKYNSNGKMIRVEYAIEIFSLMKELEIDENESESIDKIRDHFDVKIRHTLIGQQIKTKNDLFKILSEYDSDDKKERLTQNRTAYQNKGGTSQKTQQNGQSKPWQNFNVNAIRTYDVPKDKCQIIVRSNDNCVIENYQEIDNDLSKMTSDSGKFQ